MTLRRLRPEEVRLWALVASTVPGARIVDGGGSTRTEDTATGPASPAAPDPPGPRTPVPAEALAKLQQAGLAAGPIRSPAAVKAAPSQATIEPIEPNRKRRIVRAREPIGGRLDLHGFDQDRARAALHAFVAQAQADGARAVLVITGKGRVGEGLLRRRAPEWLAEPPSRARVAGVSVAEARHGGEGALYVALKRGR